MGLLRGGSGERPVELRVNKYDYYQIIESSKSKNRIRSSNQIIESNHLVDGHRRRRQLGEARAERAGARTLGVARAVRVDDDALHATALHSESNQYDQPINQSTNRITESNRIAHRARRRVIGQINRDVVVVVVDGCRSIKLIKSIEIESIRSTHRRSTRCSPSCWAPAANF